MLVGCVRSSAAGNICQRRGGRHSSLVGFGGHYEGRAVDDARGVGGRASVDYLDTDARRWPVASGGKPLPRQAVAADRVALAPNRCGDGEDDTTVPRDRSFVPGVVDGAVVYTGYHDSVASVPRDRNVPSGLRGHTSSVWFAVGAGAAWREQEVSGTATPFGAYTEGGVALSGRVGASILWAPRIGCDVDGVVVSALNTEGSTRVWPTARAQAHLWGRAGLDALEVVGSLGVGYARTTVSGWGRERAFAVDLPLLLPGLEVRRVWERWRTSVRLEGLLASAWRPSGAHGRVLVGARISERASVRLDGLVRVHHVEAFALNANGRAQGLDTYAAATVGGEWSW